jgi:hypothetical protein
MTAPTHSLSVRPEHLPVPPDWVLRLRVGSASTQQVAPLRLTPGYRADKDLPGRGPCTPLEVRVSARDVHRHRFFCLLLLCEEKLQLCAARRALLKKPWSVVFRSQNGRERAALAGLLHELVELDLRLRPFQPARVPHDLLVGVAVVVGLDRGVNSEYEMNSGASRQRKSFSDTQPFCRIMSEAHSVFQIRVAFSTSDGSILM